MEGGAGEQNFERDYPITIFARGSLIWLSGFGGDDLNVKVYDG